MSTKKKPSPVPVKPALSAAAKGNAIRLRPSASDYATFAKTTADAMGRSAPGASAPKPNKRLLSLLGLGA